MLKKRLQKDTAFKLHLEQAKLKSAAIQRSHHPPAANDAELTYYSTFILGLDCFNQTNRASRILQSKYYRDQLNHYVDSGQWPKPKQRPELLPWFALAYPDFPLPVSAPKATVPKLLPVDTGHEEGILFAAAREQMRKTLHKAELKRLRLLKKKKAAKLAALSQSHEES
ncbi:hypothetical protein R6242_10735 [Iodobacter sp. CM08]|uniref:hypothetical protein n=1 Tax=Iodobacter sp. CM08 TaxID=3085902 RepID=UPI002981AC62|nr:hypothetical protein [Iodobacter sp. CM08]MDW5417040.1 hypothetical protein [Iodobacter sp. CM08]